MLFLKRDEQLNQYQNSLMQKNNYKDFNHDQKIIQKANQYHLRKRNFAISQFFIINILIVVIILILQIMHFSYNKDLLILIIIPEMLSIAFLINAIKIYKRANQSFEGYIFNMEFDTNYIKEGDSFQILMHIRSTSPETRDQIQTFTPYTSSSRRNLKRIYQDLSNYYQQSYVIKYPGILLPRKIDGNNQSTKICLVCGAQKQSAKSKCKKCNLPPFS